MFERNTILGKASVKCKYDEETKKLISIVMDNKTKQRLRVEFYNPLRLALDAKGNETLEYVIDGNIRPEYNIEPMALDNDRICENITGIFWCAYLGD